MVAVTQESNRVIFEVMGLHKLWALKKRLDIPRAHILGARVDDQVVRRWWKGIRFPGTWLPGVITAGTFYRDGKWRFWDVSDPNKAVVIDLEHEKYAQLIVEVADREAVIALLS